MKHTAQITALLVLLFIVTQLAGLGFLAAEMRVSAEDGQTVVDYNDVAIGPRPDTQGAGSLLYLAIGIGIGTVVILVLARFRQFLVWKIWFFIAVWLTVMLPLDTFMTTVMSLILALILAIWKIWYPNPLIHNLTEILVYSGIAILLVPIFDVLWAAILLVGIAIYDMIAVWKSGHMVTMAKFQAESKLFAGLNIPYGKRSKQVKTQQASLTKPAGKPAGRSAILGGGDIVFPLIMCGTLLELLVRSGLTKTTAYLWTLIPVAGAAIALTGLFVYAKKDHFYPAMPPITAGVLFGVFIVLLVA